MATLAPMKPRTVPALPLIRGVERHALARDLSLCELDRRYAREFGLHEGALLRLLGRGRDSGVFATRTADRLTCWLDIEPVGERDARTCATRGSTLRSSQLHDTCDPCRWEGSPWA